MLNYNQKFYLVCALAGIGIVIFFYKAWRIENESYSNFLNENYSGVIYQIKYRVENRNLPDMKIDDKWYSSYKWQMDIVNKIQVGDSISKKRDSPEVTLFRKDSAGVFIRLELENQ